MWEWWAMLLQHVLKTFFLKNDEEFARDFEFESEA